MNEKQVQLVREVRQALIDERYRLLEAQKTGSGKDGTGVTAIAFRTTAYLLGDQIGKLTSILKGGL